MSKTSDAGEGLDSTALPSSPACRRAGDGAEASTAGAVGPRRRPDCPRGIVGGGPGPATIAWQAGGDARRIGQRQVMLVGERLGGDDGELARLAAE